MGIPQMKESCCGCSLQTGSKIIGWFQLVGAVIALILVALQLSLGKYVQVETSDGALLFENPWYGYCIALAVGTIISIIVSAILLVGAYNRIPNLVCTWVVFYTICSVIFIIGQLYGAGSMFAAGFTGVGVANLIGGLLGTALQCYFILIVYSFYRELIHRPQNIAIYNSP